MSKWASMHTIPLVNEFSQDNAIKLFGGEIKTFFFALLTSTDEVDECHQIFDKD